MSNSPKDHALLGKLALDSSSEGDLLNNTKVSTTLISKDKEIKYLKSQLKGLEILLQQNADLEYEVQRLNIELDTATNSGE
jgi:hypothetical protein